MSPAPTHPGTAPVVSFEHVSKVYGSVRAVPVLAVRSTAETV